MSSGKLHLAVWRSREGSDVADSGVRMQLSVLTWSEHSRRHGGIKLSVCVSWNDSTELQMADSVSCRIKEDFLLCHFFPLFLLFQVMEIPKSPACTSTTLTGWMTMTSTTETWPYLRFETQNGSNCFYCARKPKSDYKCSANVICYVELKHFSSCGLVGCSHVLLYTTEKVSLYLPNYLPSLIQK